MAMVFITSRCSLSPLISIYSRIGPARPTAQYWLISLLFHSRAHALFSIQLLLCITDIFSLWFPSLIRESVFFVGCSASYIFAMDRKTYELMGPDYPGNRAEDVKDPSLGWMISFLFLIALVGPFSIVLLRKVPLFPGWEKFSTCIGWVLEFCHSLFKIMNFQYMAL